MVDIMLPTSWSQAKLGGSKRYNTGKPCKHGHSADRLTSNGRCCTCLATRMQDWRSANVERVSQRRRQHYLANREASIAAAKEWIRQNRDEQSRKAKIRKAANRSKYRETARAYEARNREKVVEANRLRRARVAGATGTHTAADIADIRAQQRDRCGVCRMRLGGGGHVDHIAALAKGGSNVRSNLQLLCASCNASKGARDPLEFMRSRGQLL